MNRLKLCIALAVYGDLPPDEIAEFQQHLAECPECSSEYHSLDSVRQTLDTPHAIKPTVDIRSILEESATRQGRSVRRWRRVAVGMGGIAAGLLLFVLLRLEIHIGGGQFVVRWGSPPQVEQPRVNPEPPKLVASENKDSSEMAERIRILSELVRALSTDVNSRDEELRSEITTLTARLDLLKLQSQDRWNETKQDVKALYIAQFGKKD